jgi:phosphate starvation-inducible protein PhoH
LNIIGGKSFLAAYAAAKALEQNEVPQIILLRPAVVAGKSIGLNNSSRYL